MRKLLLSLAAVSIVFANVLVTDSARAGYKMEVSENQWISLGIGLRVEAGAQERSDTSDGDGWDWDKNFDVNSVRPYINGQVHENIKFEANMELNGNSMDLLDGIVKLEFSDAFNIWGGQMLPPSDRANLSGPYYLNTWAFPVVAQRYPAVFAGRDVGATVWGTVSDGLFKYQVGLFEGNDGAGAPQLNARLTLNLLDSEGTGYYNQSTYFGQKDILAIGGVVQWQADGSGRDAAGNRKNFTAWNIDVLWEMKMTDMGAPSINGAWFDYDDDNADNGDRADGESWFITAGWYLPGEYGCGNLKGILEPTVRYQKFYNDDGPNPSRWDAGLNWYINEQNTKFVVFYSHEKKSDVRNSVNVGVQVQF